MEIVLAHLYSNFSRHRHQIDGDRHVRRAWCIDDDWLFRTLCGALYIPGSRRVVSSNTVSWAIPDVVAAQPEIFGLVFCSSDGMARQFHFYDVDVFPRLLLRRHLLASRRA